MEKLHQLAERTEDRLDLIVVDTPPANHALDFLEAPNRMLQALDLRADVGAFLEGRFLTAARYSLGQRLAKWVGRHRGVSAVAAARSGFVPGI